MKAEKRARMNWKQYLNAMSNDTGNQSYGTARRVLVTLLVSAPAAAYFWFGYSFDGVVIGYCAMITYAVAHND